MTAVPFVSPAYRRVLSLIERERCVVLDGATGTELPGVGAGHGELDERLWGTRALIDTPDLVAEVHRRYVATGCDVISTNTWGVAAAATTSESAVEDGSGAPVHWVDVARRGLRLAHHAVAAGGRAGACAVAFSLNGDVDSADGRETIRLLARMFADEPARPDLILVETLSVLSPSLCQTVDDLLATGLPVWLSFRRCRHGLCGVFGQHWGGPEGDSFGRAARRFEQAGVGALLINCIPPDHVDGMVPYLRDFTDLPLGVYPNLGYFTEQGWRFDTAVDGPEYARMAVRWREEGAQLIGGCCGVRPDHIEAASRALEGTKPGRARRAEPDLNGQRPASSRHRRAMAPWTDRRERPIHPLPFPDLSVDAGVQRPGESSFMVWRYLFEERIGAHQRCLDVGCGTGILAVQLGLNGADHVHAIDIDGRAVANTLANAFRNAVHDRITAATVDIFPWVPDERYEVIVASLMQQPVEPIHGRSTHRIVDYWGRNLLDQVIVRLSEALSPEGRAYLMQLSILSRERTMDLLQDAGFQAEVVDYTLFNFPDEHRRHSEQIERVEKLSDAYHVRLGDGDVMVAYLLEVSRKPGAAAVEPAAWSSLPAAPP